MKVISFFNVKGGVGKTTSAINVAYILSTRGNKVLLIDLDPQANATDFFDENCTPEKQLTIQDVFLQRNLVSEVARKTRYEGLDFIPSTIELNRAEKELLSNTLIPQQFILKKALEKAKDSYDYVVIDCSPAAETLTNINAIVASTAVFVPLKYDKWTIMGLQYTLEIINTVSQCNDDLEFGGAFFVQKENRIVNTQVNDLIKNMLGEKLFHVTISKNKAAEESSFYRKPILEYDKKCKMANEYIQLTEEIIKRVEK